MSEFNECYPIANPMETLCTVLSEVKISPVYNALAMETELWHGRNKVGHITFQTDVVSGRNIPVAHTEGGQSMSILTTGDIDEFKEKIMKENNIEDQSGLEIIVQYRSEDTPRLKVIKKGNWEFLNRGFIETLNQAEAGDIIYCDPPYFGRYVDYYNGWTEEDEEKNHKE